MTKANVFMKRLTKLAHQTSRWGVNPDDTEELVLGDAVALEMEPVGTDWVHFLSIRSLDPGKGAGSDVMKQLISLVDDAGVYLVGKIRPYDTKVVSKKQLRKWYRKFGCKPLNERNPDGLWIRIPKDLPYKEPILDKVTNYRVLNGYSLDDYQAIQKRNLVGAIAITLLVGYLLRYKL